MKKRVSTHRGDREYLLAAKAALIARHQIDPQTQIITEYIQSHKAPQEKEEVQSR